MKHNKNLKLKIINYLMKNGKKSVSKKILKKTMRIFYHNNKKSFKSIYSVSLKNALIPLANITIKKRKRKIFVPFLINNEKRVLLAVKKISSFNSKSIKKSICLYNEIIHLANNKGNLSINNKETNKISFINKNFAHFRWF